MHLFGDKIPAFSSYLPFTSHALMSSCFQQHNPQHNDKASIYSWQRLPVESLFQFSAHSQRSSHLGVFDGWSLLAGIWGNLSASDWEERSCKQDLGMKCCQDPQEEQVYEKHQLHPDDHSSNTNCPRFAGPGDVHVKDRFQAVASIAICTHAVQVICIVVFFF